MALDQMAADVSVGPLGPASDLASKRSSVAPAPPPRAVPSYPEQPVRAAAGDGEGQACRAATLDVRGAAPSARGTLRRAVLAVFSRPLPEAAGGLLHDDGVPQGDGGGVRLDDETVALPHQLHAPSEAAPCEGPGERGRDVRRLVWLVSAVGLQCSATRGSRALLCAWNCVYTLFMGGRFFAFGAMSPEHPAAALSAAAGVAMLMMASWRFALALNPSLAPNWFEHLLAAIQVGTADMRARLDSAARRWLRLLSCGAIACFVAIQVVAFSSVAPDLSDLFLFPFAAWPAVNGVLLPLLIVRSRARSSTRRARARVRARTHACTNHTHTHTHAPTHPVTHTYLRAHTHKHTQCRARRRVTLVGAGLGWRSPLRLTACSCRRRASRLSLSLTPSYAGAPSLHVIVTVVGLTCVTSIFCICICICIVPSRAVRPHSPPPIGNARGGGCVTHSRPCRRAAPRTDSESFAQGRRRASGTATRTPLR
jgi:hypothetical protein